jgi:hypothetical protein
MEHTHKSNMIIKHNCQFKQHESQHNRPISFQFYLTVNRCRTGKLVFKSLPPALRSLTSIRQCIALYSDCIIYATKKRM